MARSKKLFARHDTFLGVCEGIGQDFGFNPNWLRLVAAVSLLVFPMITVATYVGLAVVVHASRRIFPVAQPAAPVEAAPVLKSENDAEQVELAQAA